MQNGLSRLSLDTEKYQSSEFNSPEPITKKEGSISSNISNTIQNCSDGLIEKISKENNGLSKSSTETENSANPSEFIEVEPLTNTKGSLNNTNSICSSSSPLKVARSEFDGAFPTNLMHAPSEDKVISNPVLNPVQNDTLVSHKTNEQSKSKIAIKLGKNPPDLDKVSCSLVNKPIKDSKSSFSQPNRDNMDKKIGRSITLNLNPNISPIKSEKVEIASSADKRWQHCSVSNIGTIKPGGQTLNWNEHVRQARKVKVVGKRSSPVKITKSPQKSLQNRPKTDIPNAKIFSSLKQVNLRSMLNVDKPMVKEDDISDNLDNKVQAMVKNYEKNFVCKSPSIQHHTEVKIEQNLANDGRVKNALEALMKSRGGDTPNRKTPRKRGQNTNSGNKKLKRLDKDKTTPLKNLERWRKWSEK